MKQADILAVRTHKHVGSRNSPTLNLRDDVCNALVGIP